MGTPLLAALRAAYPNAYLTWLAEHDKAEAIDANPYIDEYIRWDGRYWKRMLRKGHYHLWLWRALRFRRELRLRQFDVLISFQPEEWPALLLGAGAATTIGIFDTFRRFYRATRTSPLARRYQYAYVHDDLPAHRTDQYLLALRALGLPPQADKRMQLGYTQEDADVVERFLAENQHRPHMPLVVIAPTTTWLTRNWPSERYIALGDALAMRGCRIILVGDRHHAPSESEAKKKRRRVRPAHELPPNEWPDYVREIAAGLKTPPMIAQGTLTFRQLAALIDRAALVVSGDTGPMHMAAALNTPYVALFGPTAPQWYAPLAGPGVALSHPVPCGPCDQKVCRNEAHDHRCMRLITASEVLAAAERLLSETAVSA